MNETIGRLNNNAELPLAQFNRLDLWSPKIGDFIIWHGWWNRWYGVINSIDGDTVGVIRENLPKLLFTMPPNEYKNNLINLSITKIKSSIAGEYHILQNGVWYVD
jgi:hypothetical protein